MKIRKLEKMLYLVILIEGYVILATELLAIRQIIPFVGNGIETVAIVVSAVLMPLAFGYFAGGNYKTNQRKTLRKKLITNIITAAFILTFGLSYAMLEMFFLALDLIGISGHIIQTSIYSLLFIAYPVFLLGQTVPLISNYFSHKKLSQIAGKMLFFSTIGSFLGSIISTLLLMTLIGVNNTVIVTIMLLALLAMILSNKIISKNSLTILFFVSFVAILNNNDAMQKLGIVENNGYSTIKVIDEKDANESRILSINNSVSSRYSSKLDGRFDYIKYVENTFIKSAAQNKKNILVIGAGGFSIGIDDDYNEYTFIDIDKSLKKVSEKKFLKKVLGGNKIFIAESARSFLRHNVEKYDLIFVDAYSNRWSIPSDLITKEFFVQVKNSLRENGIAVFNIVTSANFQDRFGVKLDNTFRIAFDRMNRHVIGDYDSFSKNGGKANVIYSYFKQKPNSEIYTDNKNSYFLDKDK
jgi:spermidine synthase